MNQEASNSAIYMPRSSLVTYLMELFFWKAVILVMQSDRENKNTQLRKSHNVNVKHKLSVHLNLSLF